MRAGDTQPTEPLPDWARGDWEHAEAPRRRVWPWLVAFAVVAVLAVVAWFAADAIARQVVTNIVAGEVRSQLSLPPDHEVDVEIAGAVVPQLIAGRFDEVALASDGVTIGPVTGDVTVTAMGVAFRGDASADAATATVALGEEQLRALMASVGGFPAGTLGIDEPNVTMSTELQLLGAAVPIGVALTPGASDTGDLVLTPASLQLAGADITAEELERQFGILSNTVLRDWTVCVRQYLPAGVALTDARVEGESLVAAFAVDGRIATDPALREPGTCG